VPWGTLEVEKENRVNAGSAEKAWYSGFQTAKHQNRGAILFDFTVLMSSTTEQATFRLGKVVSGSGNTLAAIQAH
jgi:hypothetical protein